MIYQIDSDFDYQDTYLKLYMSRAAIVNQTEKGLLLVRFKGCEPTAQISSRGIIQVWFSSVKEKKRFLRMLGGHLVSRDNRLVGFEPIKTTVALDWPPPEDFEFSACPRTYRYRRVPGIRKHRQSTRSLPFPLKIFLIIGIPFLLSMFL
jgi:hypothetical protein